MEEVFKPLNNLIPEIVSLTNMVESFDYVVNHLAYERQKELYRPKCKKWVESLTREIADGSFRISREDVNEIHVKDGPKERDVQAPKIYKRIGIHAIMVVIERYTYPTLIKNTASSIKGRGMHWLHHIIEDDLKNVGQEYPFYYKNDIHHYYDSIDQNKMKEVIREYVSDPILLPILDSFITLMPAGLSKGLRSSQCFSNLYLSPVHHRMLKEVPSYKIINSDGVEETRYLYYNYCDDTGFRAKTKKELWRLRDIYVSEVERLGLTVKSNEAVRPISDGLDMCGYVHYPTHSLIRKRIKQNAARKLSKVKSRKRRKEIIGSFKGVSYTPADGKKRFPGKTTRLGNICNKQIEVHDYEKGINTSQGDDRYVVSFYDQQKKEWGKFFTASEEMKSILDQISDIEDGFPFETTIESEVFDGNKIKYKFT